MKSILTMAWTSEDPSAFDLAAKLARAFGARLVGLEPPSYGVMSMAWADAGMGAPIGGGLAEDVDPVMVAGDGTITAGTYPQTKEFNGGFTVLDVPSREAALEWAAKIAVACRCAQELREFMPDPAVGN